MFCRIILVTRDAAIRRHIQKLLTQPDLVIEVLSSTRNVWEQLSNVNTDCIIIDRALIPSPISTSIGIIRQLPDSPALVVLTEEEDARDRASLLAGGCEAVLNTRLKPKEFCDTLATILERIRARAVEEVARERLTSPPRLTDFVSHSPAMRAFMNVVYRVVNSDAPLLIQGETGAGKERLARAIHTDSSRSSGPFIAVNCGALPESLLESELFGHEQGAFTGATRSRRGCFELAHRGTIFLDEISEMPFHLQVKLLRVLQEYEIQPVGSERPIKINLRVMASTNRKLEEEVQLKRFRQDLYYRLSVVNLTIPPLRERLEDIPTLVKSHTLFLRSRIGSGQYSVTPEAMEALIQYAWPGNVRELINVVERAMLLCNRKEITLADLPEMISRGNMTNIPKEPSVKRVTTGEEWDTLIKQPWRAIRQAYLDELECEYLKHLLKSTGGHIGQTAKQAGMQPRSLFEKMRRHGLCKEDFKSEEVSFP